MSQQNQLLLKLRVELETPAHNLILKRKETVSNNTILTFSSQAYLDRKVHKKYYSHYYLDSNKDFNLLGMSFP